jgi:predicted RNA-binding Zn ribbon-like protein
MEATPLDTGGRDPAPGRLLLVQELLNSLDAEAGVDELSDVDALAAWLRGRDLIAADEPLAEGDLERARAFREGLRSLLDERSHGGIRDETVRELNELPRDALLSTRFDAAGSPQLVPAAGGLDGAIAELLAIIGRSAIDGTWSRLKVCADDTCMWAYYDRSKNRSGSWCSMAVCGNRSKARTYRERHRSEPGE